jgi:hypothetical protein
MPQPPVEMADIIRAAGAAFFDGGCKWLTWFHVKVLTAILYCRTAVLGGHVDACSRCGYQAISYNSCRNRHCPKCQANARDRWLDARCRDLLPVPYVHVVFTLPHQRAPLALQNKREIYGLLFAPAPRLCSRSPGTPNISVLRSGSSASCIPGISSYCIILMSIAWFRPAACLPITPGGFLPRTTSFYL